MIVVRGLHTAANFTRVRRVLRSGVIDPIIRSWKGTIWRKGTSGAWRSYLGGWWLTMAGLRQFSVRFVTQRTFIYFRPCCPRAGGHTKGSLPAASGSLARLCLQPWAPAGAPFRPEESSRPRQARRAVSPPDLLRPQNTMLRGASRRHASTVRRPPAIAHSPSFREGRAGYDAHRPPAPAARVAAGHGRGR